jgi:hypothetical protein
MLQGCRPAQIYPLGPFYGPFYLYLFTKSAINLTERLNFIYLGLLLSYLSILSILSIFYSINKFFILIFY